MIPYVIPYMIPYTEYVPEATIPSTEDIGNISKVY
jgi:hypothetical protein